jgi:hypothetical protein
VRIGERRRLVSHVPRGGSNPSPHADGAPAGRHSGDVDLGRAHSVERAPALHLRLVPRPGEPNALRSLWDGLGCIVRLMTSWPTRAFPTSHEQRGIAPGKGNDSSTVRDHTTTFFGARSPLTRHRWRRAFSLRTSWRVMSRATVAAGTGGSWSSLARAKRTRATVSAGVFFPTVAAQASERRAPAC